MSTPTVDTVICSADSITALDPTTLAVHYRKLPQPGVVIFVHGVNSDAEWYDQAEEGLCKGLNTRLRRQDEHLAKSGVEVGQLAQLKYLDELTRNGFLNRKRDANTFITSKESHSPVIRFRWGYKANDDDLAEFGANVYLNENHYWGGGPFANGCTSLPDLWCQGFNDRLFLWLTAEHANPTEREVFSCPHRVYFVHAAWRLAKLVELVRSKHARVPITIVCHSQGNMIGLAAAFLGDQWPEVTDPYGKTGKAVADSYVLVNPPYSLRKAGMGTDNWAQRDLENALGERGRQTYAARTGTLKAFFDILRERAESEAAQQPEAAIDRRCANRTPQDGSAGFTAESDRAAYGLPETGRTTGRVTLYFNPADQVISAATVQGIGWMGVSDDELRDSGGKGVFSQRVWAQGFKVGVTGKYDFWQDHWDKPARGSPNFWSPPSPLAKFSIEKGTRSNESIVSKVLTKVFAPLVGAATAAAQMPINALPLEDWVVTIDAPELPASFAPGTKPSDNQDVAKKDPQNTGGFDQGKDPTAALRNKNKTTLDERDPYDQFKRDGKAAPAGNETSEAQLRYEDRARLRMLARREGKTNSKGAIEEESPDAKPSPQWTQWRNEKITSLLAAGVNENATDHSTILTNPDHAEHALAYDVAVGYAVLTEKDWKDLRVAADWRLVGELESGEHPQARFGQYIKSGKLDNTKLHYHPDYRASKMPKKIVDEREMKPQPPLGDR